MPEKASSRMPNPLIAFLQLTWGLPQTLVGAVIFLACSGMPWQAFRGCIVREWGIPAGISLGLFVFVPRGAGMRYVSHEYGHCLQSILLGPLYLPLVALPSLVWAGLPQLRAWRKRTGKSYYSFATERSANFLARRISRLDPEDR